MLVPAVSVARPIQDLAQLPLKWLTAQYRYLFIGTLKIVTLFASYVNTQSAIENQNMIFVKYIKKDPYRSGFSPLRHV